MHLNLFHYIIIFKEFENLSVEKKTLSTALGFEPRSLDCRSTALPKFDQNDKLVIFRQMFVV